MEPTFLLSYVSKESCCKPAFYQPGRQEERSTPTRFISHHCTCSGEQDRIGAFGTMKGTVQSAHTVTSRNMISGGGRERNRRPPRRPTGPVAENDMMHRGAIQAMQEEARLPVGHLLGSCGRMGRAAMGARSSAWGSGPRARAPCNPEIPARRPREMHGALREVAPTWRNEQRIKADVAQDRKCCCFW